MRILFADETSWEIPDEVLAFVNVTRDGDTVTSVTFGVKATDEYGVERVDEVTAPGEDHAAVLTVEGGPQ